MVPESMELFVLNTRHCPPSTVLGSSFVNLLFLLCRISAFVRARRRATTLEGGHVTPTYMLNAIQSC